MEVHVNSLLLLLFQIVFTVQYYNLSFSGKIISKCVWKIVHNDQFLVLFILAILKYKESHTYHF